MKSPRKHPEWRPAVEAFCRELDIPNRQHMLIDNLIGPSLGRVYMKFWIAQDRIDPEIVIDPTDRSEDPRWHQSDGWPVRGGAEDEILRRKWERRAALYFRWNAPDIWHVADWLIYAVATNAPWLHIHDPHGEPKKLAKCGSLEQLVREANKGFRFRPEDRLHDGNLPAVAIPEPGPDDESEIADLGAGHMLVQLLTPLALRIEGARMRHCLSHGGYDIRLRDSRFRYYSVRGPDGLPIATLELAGDVVRQFRGPRDARPSEAVVDLMSRHAAENQWRGYEEASVGRLLQDWDEWHRFLGDDVLRALDGVEGARPVTDEELAEMVRANNGALPTRRQQR